MPVSIAELVLLSVRAVTPTLVEGGDRLTPAPENASRALLKSAPAREYEGQPPEKWLARIEKLRHPGRAPDADEWLAAFKQRFPDHPMPLHLHWRESRCNGSIQRRRFAMHQNNYIY